MHTLLRSFTTAVLLVALQCREAESASPFTCYQCASVNLKDQWQITALQLPSSIDPTLFFTSDCDTIDPTKTPIVTTCQDFCFTMLVTPALLNGTVGQTKTSLFVRGCHYDFTNFALNAGQSVVGRDPNNKDVGLCEYGYITRYNNNTVPFDTEAGYQWCNVDYTTGNKGPCNIYNAYLTFTGNTFCNGNANKKVQCYDCVDGSVAKPCKTGNTKLAQYCYKSDLWINNQHFITRSLSDINPLYPGSVYPGTTNVGDTSTTQPQQFEGKCGAVSSSFPVQTRSGSVTTSGYDCYCNNNFYCNGAGHTTLSFVTVSLAALGLIFIKN